MSDTKLDKIQETLEVILWELRRLQNDLGNKIEEADDGDLLEEAKEAVRQSGKASASLLQRRLKIGYARSARLLDLLEDQGIIGPADGANPRKVLIK